MLLMLILGGYSNTLLCVIYSLNPAVSINPDASTSAGTFGNRAVNIDTNIATMPIAMTAPLVDTPGAGGFCSPCTKSRRGAGVR